MVMSILMRFAEHEDGFQRDFCKAGHVRNLEDRHVEHAREIFSIFGHNEPSFFGVRNRREAYLFPRKTTKQTKNCPVCGPPVAWRDRFCRIGETSRRIPRTPENDRSETSSLFSFSFYRRFRVVFPFRLLCSCRFRVVSLFLFVYFLLPALSFSCRFPRSAFSSFILLFFCCWAACLARVRRYCMLRRKVSETEKKYCLR